MWLVSVIELETRLHFKESQVEYGGSSENETEDQPSPTSGDLPKGIERRDLNGDLHTRVHRGTVCSGRKEEAVQASVDGGTEERKNVG